MKGYARGVACSAAAQALAIVRSLYPSVRLEYVDQGFAKGTFDEQMDALVAEVTDSVVKIADDLDLFGEAGKPMQ